MSHPFPGLEHLIPADAVVEHLATGTAWGEGPVCLDDGAVLWSDIPGNCVLRWHPQEGQSVAVQPAHFHNGHTRDDAGRLYACSHGERAVLRSDDGGRNWRPIATHHGGQRLNSPNDVIVARDGGVWFSDPPYGLIQPLEGYGGGQEQPGCWVYRLDPDTGAVEAKVRDMVWPNGLAFSPDETTLYVTDTSHTHDPAGHHHIRAYPVAGHGASKNEVGEGRIFAVVDPGMPDGIRIDEHGNLWSSSGGGVQIYSPDGVRLGVVAVPEAIGNLTFSHVEPYLYIAASSSLYRLPVSVKGDRF
ncbi:SMP-30/gluconolactonase/LRE family protein [Deinococcus arenicola]|uniref:SMP-30/gluconolactonase/LRE family protein n=1 Tax=Deinococcus arenicola TaxID=2994950 RepID=A0ABU4DQ99_9DEIO|nr:SMP-30/gluconolactonase/LRE family protein [Deinococcus sp. ZS9-10]MDV6374601.1 SMP-30/gluconolactonase/LRE family protein [Deinococcus sp. ZS9-10]